MSTLSAPYLQIFSFDVKDYPFHRLIESFLEVEDLSTLSSGVNSSDMKEEWSFYKNMEQSPHFKKLYRRLSGEEGEEFYKLYRKFIENEIRPQFNEPLYYQTKPSHRIFFRDLKGTPKYHKDTDYGHHPHEINYLVPQTPAYGSNSVWIESEIDKSDFQPIDLEVGKYGQFKGATYRHGGVNNETGRTRVSFDFRVLPYSLAPEDVKEAIDERQGVDPSNPVMYNARKFAYCE